MTTAHLYIPTRDDARPSQDEADREAVARGGKTAEFVGSRRYDANNYGGGSITEHEYRVVR